MPQHPLQPVSVAVLVQTALSVHLQSADLLHSDVHVQALRARLHSALSFSGQFFPECLLEELMYQSQILQAIHHKCLLMSQTES